MNEPRPSLKPHFDRWQKILGDGYRLSGELATIVVTAKDSPLSFYITVEYHRHRYKVSGNWPVYNSQATYKKFCPGYRMSSILVGVEEITLSWDRSDEVLAKDLNRRFLDWYVADGWPTYYGQYEQFIKDQERLVQEQEKWLGHAEDNFIAGSNHWMPVKLGSINKLIFSPDGGEIGLVVQPLPKELFNEIYELILKHDEAVRGNPVEHE